MEKTYIYSDKGVGAQSFSRIRACLRLWGNGNRPVTPLSAAEVAEGKWREDARLFVMPGGASTPYSEKLNGAGMENLRDYVRTGGSYLGVCAGAYFGASRTEFNKGRADGIANDCQAGFFKGTAQGPALACYDADSNAGCRAAEIVCKGKNFKVYYNGGGFFTADEGFTDYEIAARYAGTGKPAVVFLPYGAGRVVLSHVHFEFSSDDMDASDVWQNPLKRELADSEAERKMLINMIAGYLKTEGLPE